MKSCQPFSCPCTLCDALPKRDLFDMYVQESMRLVKSKPPLPPRSLRSLRAAARSTSFIVVASSLQKIELWYPNFGLQAIDCDHATAESQWRIVEDQLLDAFSRRGLEAGLPAFQLPMVGKCDILPKGDLFDTFLAIAFGKCQASTPYQKLTLHFGCIMPIPWLQLQKKTCLMQRSKGFGHGVVVSKICYVWYSDCVEDFGYRILIALSIVTCDCCKTNEQLPRLSF